MKFLRKNKKLIINIVGGIVAIFLVIFQDPSSITTWYEARRQVIEFVSNPYEIGLSIMAVYGYITNLN